MLIEDGILVGYMQDRQNARLMGVAPTGNGRRQSYAHAPMPFFCRCVWDVFFSHNMCMFFFFFFFLSLCFV